MLIAIWIVALLCIAFWTLAVWGVQHLLLLDPSRLQDLKPLIHEIPFGETIDEWMPSWRALLATTVDLAQSLLSWAGGAAHWLLWTLWGTGTVLTLLIAAVTSLAVVLIRRGMRLEQQQRTVGAAQH